MKHGLINLIRTRFCLNHRHARDTGVCPLAVGAHHNTAQFIHCIIRINVVSPGPVHTESLETFFPPEQREAAFTHMNGQSTVGRIGTPEDIANAVVFLSNDAASYINGVELFVDGGASQI
ncbi:SDR family oxidoreductase [Advenella sp. FME57]|uniref:SDR family oxidoreductase n=1 Tax=Advenella sp. FME57 TaxID=2742604 RepID=UPI00351C77BE